MFDCNYFCEIKKHGTMKKLFSAINYSNLQRKKVLYEQLLYSGPQSFLMTCYFTKAFVHPLVIAAVCYFSVYKLLGWDSANIYLFKVNGRSTR